MNPLKKHLLFYARALKSVDAEEAYMSALDFDIRIRPVDAVRLLDDGIVNGSGTGKRIDYYETHNQSGEICIVVVYEKYYHRVGNRLTLTVIIDNMRGVTHIRSIGGGGGNGVLFRFDWGASESFTNAAWEILGPYALR